MLAPGVRPGPQPYDIHGSPRWNKIFNAADLSARTVYAGVLLSGIIIQRSVRAVQNSASPVRHFVADETRLYQLATNRR